MKFAFSTNDGKTLVKDHFGEGKFFLVYEIDNEIKFLKKIENNSKEERFHGDPEKAKQISTLLEGIDFLVGFAMGPNIVRMRKRFVPVISRYLSIEDNLHIIKDNLATFKEEAESDNKKVIIINEGPNIIKS